MYGRKQRWQPYFRKAVPKKTRILGKVKYEIAGQPLDNEESAMMMRMRTDEANRPKAEVKRFVPELQNRIIQAGTTRAANWGTNLTKTAVAKPTRKKPEVLKAARIPKNQLLDLLFQCFKQYEYWAVKALRQRVQQPEAYLRETLDEIAVLNKSGSFANLWSLKPHYKQMQPQTATVAGIAPEDEDDEDEEMEEMEDVVIS
jgi:transcription initiation factor TFIIF subunit beta